MRLQLQKPCHSLSKHTKTPPSLVKTRPSHPMCCVMSCCSNKVLFLGQSCREEQWAIAKVMYFTVEGRYMKHIYCSICQAYFQPIKDVKSLGLNPAWERNVWSSLICFLRGTLWEGGISWIVSCVTPKQIWREWLLPLPCTGNGNWKSSLLCRAVWVALVTFLLFHGYRCIPVCPWLLGWC